MLLFLWITRRFITLNIHGYERASFATKVLMWPDFVKNRKKNNSLPVNILNPSIVQAGIAVEDTKNLEVLLIFPLLL